MYNLILPSIIFINKTSAPQSDMISLVNPFLNSSYNYLFNIVNSISLILYNTYELGCVTDTSLGMNFIS